MRLIRNFFKANLSTAVLFILNLVERATSRNREPSLLKELHKRAVLDSANYAEEHMKDALSFETRETLWNYSIQLIDFEGIIAEFGVYEGYSINYLAQKLENGRTIVGFDSFVGLKEDWRGHDLTKGSFSLKGKPPKVVSNVELIEGWFDETIQKYLLTHDQNIAFAHIDCDTFEANQTLFAIIGERIVKGTIIVFDEYFGYRGWRLGEWKAWQEFVQETDTQYEYLAFSATQAVVRIK